MIVVTSVRASGIRRDGEVDDVDDEAGRAARLVRCIASAVARFIVSFSSTLTSMLVVAAGLPRVGGLASLTATPAILAFVNLRLLVGELNVVVGGSVHAVMPKVGVVAGVKRKGGNVGIAGLPFVALSSGMLVMGEVTSLFERR